MERFISGRCHPHIWFIFFSSFLLFLLFSSIFTKNNTTITFLINNYGNLIQTQNSNHSSENFDTKIDPFGRLEHNLTESTVKNKTIHVAKQTNSSSVERKEGGVSTVGKSEIVDECSGRYVYVHDLPSRFNDDVLNDCHSLIKWFDICANLENSGLGPRVSGSEHIFSSKNWFATNQFLLEEIFRNKMKKYECLTKNSSIASAIYVPVYIGLAVGRYLWGSAERRDALALDLVNWLTEKPEWKKMNGRDHFFVAGRIAWDFRRIREKEDDWGSVLMRLPEAMKMTMLSIEGTPWRSDFAVPYPTYFHPETDREVLVWQDEVRKKKRSKLFAFVGAPRPDMEDSIRGQLISQCRAANESCHLLNCILVDCEKPVTVMKTFMDSSFCLQPPGDSYTRRSAFDSILAGCIPVFFHPGSAYVQYIWHLPKNHTDYSVFIPSSVVKAGNVTIEEILIRIPKNDVIRMRENVIRMIPRITYSNPSSKLKRMEDAFDITVKGVLERVERIRRDNESQYVDDCSWFWKLNQTSEASKWAPYF